MSGTLTSAVGSIKSHEPNHPLLAVRLLFLLFAISSILLLSHFKIQEGKFILTINVNYRTIFAKQLSDILEVESQSIN